MDLTFARLREQDIQKKFEEYEFVAGCNTTIENLSLNFNIAGKPSSIANEHWIRFLQMFGGLKTISISSISLASDTEFFTKVLEAMPNLESLKLPGCVLSKENLQNLSQSLSRAESKVQNLELVYNPTPGNLTPRARSKIAVTYQEMEELLTQMSNAGKSLKTLKIVLGVKSSIEVRFSLLTALSKHTEL